MTFKYEAQEDDEFNLKVGDVIKDVHYVGLVSSLCHYYVVAVGFVFLF